MEVSCRATMGDKEREGGIRNGREREAYLWGAMKKDWFRAMAMAMAMACKFYFILLYFILLIFSTLPVSIIYHNYDFN